MGTIESVLTMGTIEIVLIMGSIEIVLTMGMMTFIPLGTVKSLPGILYRILHEMCSPVQVNKSSLPTRCCAVQNMAENVLSSPGRRN